MAKLRLPRKKDEPPLAEFEQQAQTELQIADEQSVAPAPSQGTEAVQTQPDGEIALTTKKQRIWEVDFLRGFMMLFVIWDHFMWDIRYAVGGNYQTGLFSWLYEVATHYYRADGNSLRNITHDTFVSMFVLLSGVSCSFSRNNGKRALKMVCFSALFTAVTYAAGMAVYFNVIHVVSLSVAVWAGLEWILSKLNKNWQKNIFGWAMFAIVITVLIVGYQAREVGWTNDCKLWFFLAEHSFSVDGFASFWGEDYLAFFPDFGWFLLGVFLGKRLYQQKTTLFPSFPEKYLKPLTFMGKYSIWVYFGSQALMFGFVYLFHGVLNLL